MTSRLLWHSIVAITMLNTVSAAKKAPPATPAELAGITVRGRMLAEYDDAAVRSSEAVLKINPNPQNSNFYFCFKKTSWTCEFGTFNAAGTSFLVSYETASAGGPPQFTALAHSPAQPAGGIEFNMAKAVLTAERDFQPTAEKRPYDASILPAGAGQFSVYITPARIRAGVYPLGGDVRYVISGDGGTIVEKRQLHRAIIDFEPAKGSQKIAAGVHTDVLTDVPAETDVFYVLTRKPAIPEFVTAGGYTYRIDVDGNIALVKKR